MTMTLQFRRFFWHFSVIYGFLNVLSAYIFYNYDFEKPAIWLAVTSVFLKYSWSVLFGYVIFASIYRIGWFIPDIFNHPVWTVLGRLSYAMYIFHGFPVYLIIMDVYQPVHVDLLRAVSFNNVITFDYCILIALISNSSRSAWERSSCPYLWLCSLHSLLSFR